MVRRKCTISVHFFLFVKNTQNICKCQKNVVPLQRISHRDVSFKFNNGDFAMSNYFPFSKKGGIINYYEYVCN